MKKLCFLTLFLVFYGADIATAQAVWTLERALHYAEENSLMILSAQNDIRIAEADLAAARQQMLPSLNMSSNFSLSLGRTIDPTTNEFTTESYNNQSASLNSGIQVFNGGAIRNQIKDARLLNKIARLDVNATRQDVKLAVVQQFFQALFAMENVTLARSNLDLLKEQERRTEIEVDAGAKPENEWLEIQAEVASSEQRLIQAANQSDMALLQFKQLLRLPVDEEIALEYPETEEIIPSEEDFLSLPDLRDKALAIAPSIRSAEAQVERAKLGIDLARSRYYPSLSLGGSFSSNFSSVRRQTIPTGTEISNQTVYFQGEEVTIGFESPTFRMESIPYLEQLRDNWGLGWGLQLSVPIYSQGQNRASVQRAKTAHIAAQIQKEQQTQRYTEELEQNLTELKSSFRSYLAADKTKIASSRFFENINLGYDIGASTSFELINAQNRKEESEVNYLLAKYEYLARKKSLAIYLQGED